MQPHREACTIFRIIKWPGLIYSAFAMVTPQLCLKGQKPDKCIEIKHLNSLAHIY